MLRRLAPFLLALVLGTGLVGCAAEPTESAAPTPGPRFTTEAEAFAAAEETYRAYVDALNREREDPNAAPDPQTFLISNALEEDISTREHIRQSGLTIKGNSIVVDISPIGETGNSGSQTALVCLDSSATTIVNADGLDVTPSDRRDRILLRTTFAWVGDGFLVTDSTAEDVQSC